ncbi:transglycosylase family protein [Nocardia noduli]|uniref:transglycosylase family protein n=1 Tax=Nocardia noduli TaxID=2815722 RepID=UPI001C239E44|nr:transglycosylase family protein [Nocardia noduli]
MSHNKISTRVLGFASIVGALVAIPLGLSTATASADSGHNWDAVAQCESSGNWNTNTGNGFGGGLQFTPSTWAAYGGSGSPENASRDEQIRVAENVLDGQGPGAWPVCGAYL